MCDFLLVSKTRAGHRTASGHALTPTNKNHLDHIILAQNNYLGFEFTDVSTEA